MSTSLNDFATDLVLARPNLCPNCGPWPCYHICPNSPLYYSVEQERYDEANYDRSEYYREGGFDDPDLYADRDDEEYTLELERTGEPDVPFDVPAPVLPDTSDDIPF